MGVCTLYGYIVIITHDGTKWIVAAFHLLTHMSLTKYWTQGSAQSAKLQAVILALDALGNSWPLLQIFRLLGHCLWLGYLVWPVAAT